MIPSKVSRVRPGWCHWRLAAERDCRLVNALFTFDIDVVDPAFAPGTGTPEVGGFTSGEAMRLVKGLCGLNIVGFDIVEVLPEYDPTDITALLAANIVYQFISIVAFSKKNL